jgi:hypothetical protein
MLSFCNCHASILLFRPLLAKFHEESVSTFVRSCAHTKVFSFVIVWVVLSESDKGSYFVAPYTGKDFGVCVTYLRIPDQDWTSSEAAKRTSTECHSVGSYPRACKTSKSPMVYDLPFFHVLQSSKIQFCSETVS